MSDPCPYSFSTATRQHRSQGVVGADVVVRLLSKHHVFRNNLSIFARPFEKAILDEARAHSPEGSRAASPAGSFNDRASRTAALHHRPPVDSELAEGTKETTAQLKQACAVE